MSNKIKGFDDKLTFYSCYETFNKSVMMCGNHLSAQDVKRISDIYYFWKQTEKNNKKIEEDFQAFCDTFTDRQKLMWDENLIKRVLKISVTEYVKNTKKSLLANHWFNAFEVEDNVSLSEKDIFQLCDLIEQAPFYYHPKANSVGRLFARNSGVRETIFNYCIKKRQANNVVFFFNEVDSLKESGDLFVNILLEKIDTSIAEKNIKSLLFDLETLNRYSEKCGDNYERFLSLWGLPKLEFLYKEKNKTHNSLDALVENKAFLRWVIHSVGFKEMSDYKFNASTLWEKILVRPRVLSYSLTEIVNEDFLKKEYFGCKVTADAIEQGIKKIMLHKEYENVADKVKSKIECFQLFEILNSENVNIKIKQTRKL